MPYSRLFYHFVWATRERLPLITELNREGLYAVMGAKVKKLRGIVHALNGTADHIHLVATVPPSLALSTFIGQVKGSSSHLASYLASKDSVFAWQAEYAVISLSEAHLSSIVRYVKLQQQHHAANTLQQELENCG